MKSLIELARWENIFKVLEAQSYYECIAKDDSQPKPLDLTVSKRTSSDASFNPIQVTKRHKGSTQCHWKPVRAIRSRDTRSQWHPVYLGRRGSLNFDSRSVYTPCRPRHQHPKGSRLNNVTHLFFQNDSRDSSSPEADTHQVPSSGTSPRSGPLSPVPSLSSAPMQKNQENPFKKIGVDECKKAGVLPPNPLASPASSRSSILRPSALSGFSGGLGSKFPVSDHTQNNPTPTLAPKPFVLKPSVLTGAHPITLPSSAVEPPSKKKKESLTPEKEDTSKESLEDTPPNSDDKEDIPTVPVTATEGPIESQESEQPIETGEASDANAEKSNVSVEEANTSQINGSSSESEPAKPKFIFGQNILQKVVGVDDVDSSSTSNGETASVSLFTADTAQPSWVTNVAGKSLQESSKELTEREASQKRKYDEVAVVTGEESECNVIQMTCKLYAWGSNCWHERGRGTLRLNDKMEETGLYSRLVVRMQGTLSVLLNTKIWSDMSVEKVGEKSIRFTAIDNEGQPKIYLVNGASKDMHKLYQTLQYRLLATRNRAETASPQ